MGFLDPAGDCGMQRVVRLSVPTVPISQAGVTYDAVIPYPVALANRPGAASYLLVEDVQVFARVVVATAQVDVRKGAVSLLTGLITPVAGTPTVGTLVASVPTRRFSPGDVLNLVLTTNGSGTITDLDVQLTLRPAPVSADAAA
jgi:hypothetical protein